MNGVPTKWYGNPISTSKNTFKTTAIENLDHNLHLLQLKVYSTTQLSQFPEILVLCCSIRFRLDTTKAGRSTKLALPESFIEIRPIPRPEPMQHNILVTNNNTTRSVTNKVDTWLVSRGK